MCKGRQAYPSICSVLRADIVDADRPAESLEHAIADRFRIDRLFDCRMDFAVDQYLARRRFAAQPGRQIDHRTDRRIVEAFFKSDAAKRGIAIGNADAEAELMAELAPL